MNPSDVPPSDARVAPPETRPTVVVITGLSGAGKSTALHALEDLGYFCVDNLPTALAVQAVELCEQGGMFHVALGMDVRVRAFLGAVGPTLAALEGDKGTERERDVHVVFLDASDDTLLRRFSETRRPHPHDTGPSEPAPSAALALLDELNLERERLARLRARATRVIDTTSLSVHDLRRLVLTQFGAESGGAPRMHTRFVSFGFKYGAPADADLVFDVRFLTNPYFIAALKPLSGLDGPVADFVLNLPEAREFFSKVVDFLSFVIPKYEREGKSYLTIAIGCTGGRHRSVALAEALAATISHAVSSPIRATHRDVYRGTGTVPPTSLTGALPGGERSGVER